MTAFEFDGVGIRLPTSCTRDNRRLIERDPLDDRALTTATLVEKWFRTPVLGIMFCGELACEEGLCSRIGLPLNDGQLRQTMKIAVWL